MLKNTGFRPFFSFDANIRLLVIDNDYENLVFVIPMIYLLWSHSPSTPPEEKIKARRTPILDDL